MTKQEQREAILKSLMDYKRRADDGAGMYGDWLWVDSLRHSIEKDMGIGAVKEADRIKRETVIKRLDEQGYIRISKSGKMFRVMKTK